MAERGKGETRPHRIGSRRAGYRGRRLAMYQQSPLRERVCREDPIHCALPWSSPFPQMIRPARPRGLSPCAMNCAFLPNSPRST
jgi:hypothetical protein